jgi:hypothetical protein
MADVQYSKAAARRMPKLPDGRRPGAFGEYEADGIGVVWSERAGRRP